jgi:hypothetical protein
MLLTDMKTKSVKSVYILRKYTILPCTYFGNAFLARISKSRILSPVRVFGINWVDTSID